MCIYMSLFSLCLIFLRVMTIIMDKLAKLVNNAWHFTKNSRCQLKVKLFSFRQFLVTQDSIQLIDGLNKYFFLICENKSDIIKWFYLCKASVSFLLSFFPFFFLSGSRIIAQRVVEKEWDLSSTGIVPKCIQLTSPKPEPGVSPKSPT